MGKNVASSIGIPADFLMVTISLPDVVCSSKFHSGSKITPTQQEKEAPDLSGTNGR
jgi:hypothetical protein